MPQITSTPAPVQTYDLDMIWPRIPNGTDRGNGGFYGGFNAQYWRSFAPRPVDLSTGSGGPDFSGPGSGGGGVTSRFEISGGVQGYRFGTTAALAGNTIRMPVTPQVYDPGALGGNMIGPPDPRVVWLREVLRYETSFGDAGSGHVWSWDAPSPAAVNWAQAGALFLQHGVYGNGAGGLEYRAYSAAAALVDQVAIPAAAVGPYFMLDHQFIAWAPGRAASYELRCNGGLIVQRNFGSAQLPFPDQPSGRTLCMFQRMTAAAGMAFWSYMHLRAGRFTMDGLELRS